ncbi:exonuclease domain-containing protein [Marinobacterium stanieri]|uniref:3'-5' exonuclease n=1 Tax=Marinobacterium stanieri TaxID=49186 RepID=UPI003A8F3FFA
MPNRQNLIGIWLLLTGAAFVIGIGLAMTLISQLQPPVPMVLVWTLGLLPGALLLALGLVLEWRLFAPLRQLQVLLARLLASPDAKSDFPLAGWLNGLQSDLDQIRNGWRQDRQRLKAARTEGAQEAASTQQELESLVQSLSLPLLICDKHQRLLLFNQAAVELLGEHSPLGLGRPLTQVLPHSSLKDALNHFDADSAPHPLLLPGEQHWLRCEIRALAGASQHRLITLQDSTAALRADQQWQHSLSQLLPRLRGHAGSLGSATEALIQSRNNPDLSRRLEQAIEQDSEGLAHTLDSLTRLIESHQLGHARLEDTWSNDLCHALQAKLKPASIQITPIGIPAWLKVDGPSLLALLEHVLRNLKQTQNIDQFELELLLGNRRVYLDLCWQGEAITETRLASWREQSLFDEPLSPRFSDVLSQHGADLWSLPNERPEDPVRLRLPLPASSRGLTPVAKVRSRPEFHDFSIAQLAPPDQDLASRPLDQLELVVFDTETTGLDLRGGDRIISLAGCRILNGRLLADDSFDQLVNPGRSIPQASTAIHGLTDDDVAQAPPVEVVLPNFHRYAGNAVLVAHNAAFDVLALQLAGPSIEFTNPVLDTLFLSRALDPTLDGHGLDALAERFELQFPPGTRHTALGDARVTAELLLCLLPRLKARGVHTLGEALALQAKGEHGQ